jgi:TP901 family phage tail tape measure protein
MTSVGSAEISVRLAREELRRDIAAAEALLRELGDQRVDVDTKPAQGSLQGLGKFSENLFQGIAQGIGQQITSAVTRAVAGSVQAVTDTIGDSLNKSKDFGQQIRVFGAYSDATQADLAGVRQEIEKLAITSTKTPTAIAAGSIELTKLGFSATKVKDELGGLVAISESTGESLEKSAGVAAATNAVYKRSFNEIADIIATTANESAADVSDFSQAISKFGSVAVFNNQSLETVAVSFGLVRDAGFEAERAGTALKNVITSLAAPTTEEAKAAIADLGVQVRDSSGEMRDLVQLIPEFRSALSKFAPDQKAQIVKTIFGDEGGPAFLALLATSQERIDEFTSAVNNAQGAAAQTTKKLIQGLAGEVTKFQGSFETLQIRLGDSISPAAEAIVKLGVKTANSLLNTEGLFDNLTQASSRFAKELESNEELSKGIEIAVAGFVDELANQGISLIKDFTQTLRENPKLLAEMVTVTSQLIKLLGEAAKLAVEIGTGVSQGAEEVRIALSLGGSDAEGAKRSLKSLGSSEQDIKKFEEEIKKRFENEGGKYITIAGKRTPFTSPFSSKALEKSIDETYRDFSQKIILKRKEDVNKSAKLEYSNAQKIESTPASTQKTQPKTEKPKLPTNRVQTSADREFIQKRTSEEIKGREADAILAAREQQLKAGADPDSRLAAEKDIANIRRKSNNEEIADAQKQLKRLNAERAKGIPDIQNFALREAQLNTQIKNLKLKNIEAEIEYREKSNQEILQGLERANVLAEAKIRQSTATRVAAVQQAILLGKKSEENAAIEIGTIRQEAASEEIKRINNLIKETNSLQSQGVLSEKQAVDKKIALQDELAKKNDELLNLQIEGQKKLRDQAIASIEDRIAADKRRFSEAISNLDAEQKRTVEFAQKTDEILRGLIESRSKLDQARGNLAQSRTQYQISRANQALDIARQLKNEDLDPNVRQTLDAELGYLGFGKSEIEILQRKQQLENDLAKLKATALEKQQELTKKLEELDIRRLQFAQKQLEFESKSALLKAKQQENESKSALEKAEKLASGRERERAMAEANSEITQAKEAVQLAQEGINLAKAKGLALQEEIANRREILKIEQQQQSEEFSFSEQDRTRQNRIDFGKLGINASDAAAYIPVSPASDNQLGSNPISIRDQLNFQPDANFLSKFLEQSSRISNLIQPQGVINPVNIPQFDVNPIVQELQKLNQSLLTLASRPDTVNISSPNPVEDAAEFYSQLSRRITRSQGI